MKKVPPKPEPKTCPHCGGLRDYEPAFQLDEPIPTIWFTSLYWRPSWADHEQCKVQHDRIEQERKVEEERLAKRKSYEKNLQYIGVAVELADARTLETFKVRPGNLQAFTAIKRWNGERYGYLLFGNPGCGKTHLVLALAGNCARTGRRALFRNVSDLMGHLRALTMTNCQQSEEEIKKLQSVPVLILDDLGVERETAFVQEQLTRIISHRELYRLATFITTNLGEERLSEVLPLRVMSRLKATSVFIRVEDDDHRGDVQAKIFLDSYQKGKTPELPANE